MKNYYVHIIGPYDSTFVGPFTHIDGAADYTRSIDRSIFSAYILPEDEFRANQNEFGATSLQDPEGVME